MEKFNKIPEGNPFRVPENYFDEVNRKIMASAREAGIAEMKQPVLRRMRPYLAAAASAAVLVILTFIGIHNFSPEGRMKHLVANAYEEISADALEGIDISALEEQANLEGVPAMGYDLESDDIIEYLISDNIHISEIEDNF